MRGLVQSSSANLTWDDTTGSPRSVAYDDIYFNPKDGLAETRHVFLAGNDLADRFANAQGCFRIGELGFGSGLNFLATWQLWEQQRPACGQARLEFVSVEAHPLSLAHMARALALFPDLTPYAERWLALYDPATTTYTLAEDVALRVFWTQATEALSHFPAPVDAWFFDGFTPKTNPALWTADLFTQCADKSAPKASFATYSAAGSVRSALESAGFSWQRVKGFGRKKHQLRGQLCR